MSDITYPKELSWKWVLYSSAPNAEWWGDRDAFRKIAESVGYSYFEWNGLVYDTATGEVTDARIID
jgi:hypothetical protein